MGGGGWCCQWWVTDRVRREGCKREVQGCCQRDGKYIRVMVERWWWCWQVRMGVREQIYKMIVAASISEMQIKYCVICCGPDIINVLNHLQTVVNRLLHIPDSVLYFFLGFVCCGESVFNVVSKILYVVRQVLHLSHQVYCILDQVLHFVDQRYCML